MTGKKNGKSEARKRQGGDIVPVPPRSCDNRESCYGLAVTSPASETAAPAIAGKVKEGKERDRREEKKGEERDTERAQKMEYELEHRQQQQKEKPKSWPQFGKEVVILDSNEEENGEFIIDEELQLRELNDEEESLIQAEIKKEKSIDKDPAEFVYQKLEWLAKGTLSANNNLEKREYQFMMLANMTYIIMNRREGVTKSLKKDVNKLKEENKKSEEKYNSLRAKCENSETRDVEIQVQIEGAESMVIEQDREQEGTGRERNTRIEEEIRELKNRIRKLEETQIPKKQLIGPIEERDHPWSKVVGKAKRRRVQSLERRKEQIKNTETEEIQKETPKEMDKRGKETKRPYGH